jgi:carbon monoxide dehydrogenase subunit G
MQVGGKVAAVGQRLLDSVSRMMARQGLEALSTELERRLAGSGA